MAAPRESLIPNSTQVPNVLMDLVMPRIQPSHERCLRYICRRTFGFQKKTDRIGLSQFVRGIRSSETGAVLDYGAGLPLTTVREALEDLEAAGLVVVERNRSGRTNGYRIRLDVDPDDAVRKCMESWEKRTQMKRTKKPKQSSLFTLADPVAVRQGVAQRQGPCRTSDTPPVASATIQNKEETKKKQSIAGETPAPSRFNEFLKWYEDLATRTRSLKLALKVTAAGKSNLGKFLQKYKPEWDLMEQLALYFLVDPHYRQFSPGLETFLSAGIMNGLLNDASNREDFWKKVDGYVVRYLREESTAVERREQISLNVRELLAGMKMPEVLIPESV